MKVLNRLISDRKRLIEGMRSNSIQACRGTAALLVVAFHLGGAFAAQKYFNAPVFIQFTRFGSAGVEFFFVLSGYIISASHADEINHPDYVLTFLRKRAIRIYLTFWLVFCFVAISTLLLPGMTDALPKSPLILLKTLLLLPQDPQIVGGTGAPLIVVAWSMQYEVIFYLLFSIFIFSLRLGIALTLLLGALFCATRVVGVNCLFLYFLKWQFFIVFGMGVGAALFLRKVTIQRPILLVALALLVLFSLASIEISEMVVGQLWVAPQSPPPQNTLIYGFASMLLIAGLVSLENKREFYVNSFLLALGDISYSIYLTHFPIISLMCKIFVFLGLTETVPRLLSFTLIVLSCIAVGAILHFAMERHILRWLRTNLIVAN